MRGAWKADVEGGWLRSCCVTKSFLAFACLCPIPYVDRCEACTESSTRYRYATLFQLATASVRPSAEKETDQMKKLIETSMSIASDDVSKRRSLHEKPPAASRPPSGVSATAQITCGDEEQAGAIRRN